MKLIDHAAIRIATESFGSPEDEPIVLSMGATTSMLGWPLALCDGLAAAGFFVIRYDHRDTGLSTTWAPGEGDYGVMDLSDDLVAILDGYGLAAAHVVGMSLGGFIGQITALRAPERIRTLTLIGSEPLGWDGEPLPHISDAFMTHFADFGTLDWTDREAVTRFLLGIAELSAGSAHPFDQAAARAVIEADLDRSETIRSAFNHSTIGADLDPTLRLQDITQPVLVIHGSEDPVLPLPNGEAIARTAQHGELFVLEGTGHELAAADLPAIEREIVAFARRHPIG